MEKRVFNQDKTQELTEYDLTLGRLSEDKLLLAHHDAVAGATEEENALALQGEGKTVTQIGERWYEVTAVYTNETTDPETGETTSVPKGRDLKRIAATPAKEAWDETEDIYVYVPYTATEIVERQKAGLRRRRAAECFPIVNRGELWYDKLTEEQKSELSVWYEMWLDAPQTLSAPAAPSWIDGGKETE